ncbi:lead, cadmium, zinc and mercury transporting ATPase [Lachnospiraceae bacterium KM106-2]|nr:lead, cadmium, zinc and mercury transporting ATPase [Lachnospiraceae bacterium KM106-2]
MKHKLSPKQRKALRRILAGAMLFVFAILLSQLNSLDNTIGKLIVLGIFLVTYFVIGGDVLYKAIRNIKNGQIFDENFLMCVATIGAFALREYSEAVAVMLFYQVGELFQSYAVSSSRQSISDLMNIRPDYANIEVDGTLTQVDPDDVAIGDIIVVKAGEKIPLDGKVIKGETMVDTSALTGESVPRKVNVDDMIYSGCVNMNGLIYVEVTKEFDDSTVAKILEMVENASSKKAKAENFITKFAKYYTPIVVGLAVLLSILPPLILGESFLMWIQRALTFLVISCPCALVISVPLSFFGGIGGASKTGILIKGSNYLEVLSEVKTIVFDKTGTLTKGNFKVTKVNASGVAKEDLLRLAAYVENYSDHPIAKSIKDAYGEVIDSEHIKDVEEISGHGVCAIVDGEKIYAGNNKLMEQFQISYEPCKEIGTIVYVAKGNTYLGSLVIADEIKEDSLSAISLLKKVGIKNTIMLTGDRKEVGEAVAAQLGMNGVYTELLPGDKVDKIEEILAKQSGNDKVAFVGDGINDAPVLSRVDLGIAMGGMGSDAAIEAADIVLMNDEISKIAMAVRIARKTLTIVRENIAFAIGVKVIVLILGALGIANMWWAVFADVGVAVIAILNAMRALSIPKMK